MAEPAPTISIEHFRKLTPINGLREESLQQLYRRVAVHQAKPGEDLFKVGSATADSFYLLSGELELRDHAGVVVRNLTAGTVDCEHRIAHQIPRKVSARCHTAATYLRIDSSLLDVMLTWDQTDSFEVDELRDEQAESSDWMTRLLQMSAFQRVPPAHLQAMFMRLEAVQVQAGDVVIRQDEEGDYFYVLIAGRCLVTRETPTSPKPIRLAELDRGSCFGEEALISDDKRNATVTMLENGTLMRLAKDDFRSLLTAPLTRMIDQASAQKLVEDGAAIYMDVRLPSEYKNNHLQDALNIPLFILRPKLDSLDKSTSYVVYCDGGRRSEVAAFVLTQKGYDVQVLKGGIAEDPV